jgi:pimeloyl-ACP methyl ester carboxylesterase
MSKVRRAYVDSRFGQLHYRIARPDGEPSLPPLLCFHQTPQHGGEWEPLLPRLSHSRVVIAPDTPGYGNSDAPPEVQSIEALAEVMGQLADDLDLVGPIDVMGIHTGSIIATELALQRPAQVGRVVLCGLAAYSVQEREAKLASLPDRFPAPDGTLHQAENLWSFISQYGDPRMSAEQKQVAMAESLRLGARLPWAFASVYRYDFQSALDRIDQKVLVINPEDDLWEPTRANSGRIRNGERWDLPGLRHGFLQFEPDLLAQRIDQFLSEGR